MIGATPNKCITIYNGIKIDKQNDDLINSCRETYGIRGSVPVVGMIARFSKEKDHKTFLLAAHEVLKQHIQATFLLIGDGNTKKEMESFAEYLGISDSTVFTGFVDNTSDIIPTFDIGCLSSIREGLGIVLLEYMTFSLPIVATKVGGIPEVVKDGVNGMLVEPGDYAGMAQKIIELLKDVNLRRDMGKNGLSIFKQNFTQELMIKKIENLYSNLLHQEITN